MYTQRWVVEIMRDILYVELMRVDVTRSIVKDVFKSICNKNSRFIAARRVGRKPNSTLRMILVKLKDYHDKEFFPSKF